MLKKMDDGDKIRHYVILKNLGRSDNAVVYLARDELHSRKWVIKEIECPVTGNDNIKSFKSNFLQICEQMAAIDHKAIVRIVDYFIEENNRFFIVREYMEGHFLNDFIAMQKQDIPEERIKTWVAQLFDILEYLHSRKPPVIMGVIVPKNILVSPMGRIRLMDLGLARFFDPKDQAQLLMKVSPGYLAPEMVSQKRPPDQKGDIYSMGALMHYFFCRKDPNENPFDLADITTYRNDLSDTTVESLNTALCRNPSNRYKTINEFKEAFLGIKQKKETADLVTSVKEILVEDAPADQLIQGAFDIKSKNRSWMEGVIIPRYSWLKVYPDRFSGSDVHLKFWIDTAYMKPGSAQENNISIQTRTEKLDIPVTIKIMPGFLRGLHPIMASVLMFLISILSFLGMEFLRESILSKAWKLFEIKHDLLGKGIETIRKTEILIQKMNFDADIEMMAKVFAVIAIIMPYFIPLIIGKIREKLDPASKRWTMAPSALAMILPSLMMVGALFINPTPANMTVNDGLIYLSIGRYLIPFISVNLLTSLVMVLPKNLNNQNAMDRSPGLKLLFGLIILAYFAAAMIYLVIK